MAHHKRKRPKSRRAGCLYCKPHKRNGAKNPDPPNVRRQKQISFKEAFAWVLEKYDADFAGLAEYDRTR